MEPGILKLREQWRLLARMLPLVENSFNRCELGPRSTGQSYLYRGISPNNILVPGGQTTFANMLQHGPQDGRPRWLGGCMAFDEVAGSSFKGKGWSSLFLYSPEIREEPRGCLKTLSSNRKRHGCRPIWLNIRAIFDGPSR
ncbi:MAG: BREX system Lon protease-like protein BrxL [Aristaeellaceae bacterium]